MRALILTEGGKDIGFGHITRCTSLYQAFEERGMTPEFIVNGDDSTLGLLRDRDYRIFNWWEEKDELVALVKDAKVAIIDSYLADISCYETLSELVKMPVYIDDNKRLDYPPGIVVNGSIRAEEIDYPDKEEVLYLLGPRYIPLRREFWEVPEKKIRDRVESIMITFGGDDERAMAPKILKFLDDKYPELIKNIIIGRGFQNIREIEKCKKEKTNFLYYPNTEGMKKVMLEVDIAISAGGQTLYELARVGIPTIGICIADDQVLNLENWQKEGFIEYSGWYNDEKILFNLENSINKLVAQGERVERSTRGKSLVDGKGGKRITDLIEEKQNCISKGAEVKE